MHGTPPRPPLRGLPQPQAGGAAPPVVTGPPEAPDPDPAADSPPSPQPLPVPTGIPPSPAHHDLAALLQQDAAPAQAAAEEAEAPDDGEEDPVETPSPLPPADSPAGDADPETPLTAQLIPPTGASDESGASDSE